MTRWIFIFLALALAAPSSAGEVVIDADTGEVVAGAGHRESRFPASITKLMTIYVALDAAARGEVSLDDNVVVSAHAAAAPPVKLGLRRGAKIRLEKAIHAALTLSSNDAARVIAEAVSGDEAAFAARMTRTARRLGMTSTVFRNASGLPDPGHVSTTADLARLVAALDRAHGPYVRVLFRATLRWAGRAYGPRNGTVAAPAGAVLGKTGFTCAAGYTAAMLLETPEGRFAVATTANGGKGARAASLARLTRGEIRARTPKQGCAASPTRPTPHLAPRERPLAQWALTLGVFAEEAEALAALDAARRANAAGEYALGRRAAGPGVYALLLAANGEEAMAERSRLADAGVAGRILAPRGAAILGLTVTRAVGG